MPQRRQGRWPGGCHPSWLMKSALSPADLPREPSGRSAGGAVTFIRERRPWDRTAGRGVPALRQQNGNSVGPPRWKPLVLAHAHHPLILSLSSPLARLTGTAL